MRLSVIAAPRRLSQDPSVDSPSTGAGTPNTHQTSRSALEPREGEAPNVARGLSRREAPSGGTGLVMYRAWGTKSALGALTGRSEVAVLAVSDPGIAAVLVTAIDCLAGLEG